MNKNKSLLILINVDWLFLAQRLELAKAALNRGFQTFIVAKDTGRKNEIEAAGFHFIDLNISRSGVNPFMEIKTLIAIYRIYKKIKPDIVYHVTMKPVIYGSLISRLLKIRSVNTISGLGYNFTQNRRGTVQKVMILLMKIGFGKERNHLIFENNDDYNELAALGLIDAKNKISLLRGVGVDLDKFKPHSKALNEKVVVILPTRMLWDKGVREFIEASKLLRKRYFGKVFFKLYGMIDLGNKESVSENYLKNQEIENYLKWFGHEKEIDKIYKSTDIVVLPSYREGMPTSLLEASASGLPIITTDSIGCKNCVEEGLNGYKVPVKSITELAIAIEKLINSPEDRIRMGIYGRQKAEKEFDQRDVIKKYMDIYASLLNN